MRVILALLVISAACARPPAPVTPVPDLSPLLGADARVLNGCYDCLLEAREIYEHVGAQYGRALVLPQLFEAQILIALRQKELAFTNAANASFGRARELGSELPSEADAERYLALFDLVSFDNMGTPRAEAGQFRLARAARVPAIDAELAWLRTATTLREPARQYLSLAVDCAHLARPRRLASLAPAPGVWTGAAANLTVKADLPPLVAYRAAVCDTIVPRALERVRTSVPQFAEAAFFLARPELQASAQVGGGRARALIDEAIARFADSPSITYLSGNLFQLVGDCRRAVDLYDRTLAVKPLHEDALLGRTSCLSFLGRTDEAIAEATHMIELRTDNWGEAFYWRAWNHHEREELTPARADVEQAKTLSRQVARNYTLAGMIEHDQNDLFPAERDLHRAIDAWGGNCVAIYYLGLVKLKQTQPLAAGDFFHASMDCYATDVSNEERALREMQARTDLDPEFRARQIAGFEAALVEDRRHQYAAAFNAANSYAQGGNTARARTLVEIAAKEPALADKVAQLRDILKDKN